MSRKSKVAVGVVLIAVALGGLAAAGALFLGDESGGPTYVIVGDEDIGGFPRDGTVSRAIEIFGAPSSRDGDFEGCTLTWRRLGLTMTTYFPLGESDPCGPTARHSSTTVTDPRWQTSDGLRIGDPVADLRRLYPEVQEFQGAYELLSRPIAGQPLVSLEAKVRNGRVVAFTVHGERGV